MQEQVSKASLKYLGTSAQKVRLVVDLIRGKPVEEALSILRFTKKAVAPEIGTLVDSAIANARQKQQDIDVDRLFIQTVFVDGGPTLKRVRPAPMGRAFRILKRMCHVTVGLGQKTAHGTVLGDESGPGGKRTAAAALGEAPARKTVRATAARKSSRDTKMAETKKKAAAGKKSAKK